jgi:putative CocE/NonD family hydrolase
MIGPWTHGGFTARQGDYDFGSTAARDVVAYIFEWIDANAKQPNDPQKQTRVSYFEMGTNVWRTTTAWPPNDVSSVTMALSSGGHANSAQGDGILLLDSKAEASGSDSFTYDPKNPVQTAGGGLCCGVVAPGAFDQSKAEARSDVLVYSSEPLKSDLNLTGNLTVRLFVKTSAKDTDFTAKLVDVMLDGSTRNVADNILRLRYRKSLQRPAFLKPGDLAEIEIPIGPTSNVFLTGHRVRLEVSSSNFPRFARNLNTRKDGYHTTASVPAVNTVVHDATHPSSLIVTGGATTSR